MSCACGDEAWRPVVGVAGYEVSNHGRVRNAATGRVLTPASCGRTGTYLKVSLGRAVQRMVHRLVAEAWHGTPADPTDHADHLDFDPSNNHACNLRWLSASLNLGRQIRRGATGWETVADEDPPADHRPLTPAELDAAEAALSAAGW